jgi:hypothetical protein
MDFGCLQPGVWRYRIDRLADSHQSHFIQVVTKTSSEDLTTRLYTNVELDRPANLSSTPLVLYVEVSLWLWNLLIDTHSIHLLYD